MTLLFTRHLTRGLLLISALLVQLTAHAQLELFSITKSDNSVIQKAGSLPPTVNVFDNRAQQERNYNIQLVDTTPSPSPPKSELPKLSIEVAKKELQIDSVASIRDRAKDNKQTEEQNKQNEVVQRLIKEKNELVAFYTKRQEEEAAFRRSLTQNSDALKRQLHDIYEEQLGNLRIKARENNSAYKLQLNAYRTSLQTIKKYKDEQKAADDLDKEGAIEWYKAYREFDEDVRLLGDQLAEADTAYTIFQKSANALDIYKIGPIDTSRANRIEYNRISINLQTATTILSQKLDTVGNRLRAYNQKIEVWEKTFETQQATKAAADDNIIAQPVLTSITGTGVVIPAVTLIGSHRGGDVNSPNMYSIRLFTALASTDNTKNIPSERGSERLFIPEASTFGFTANATFAMKYADRKEPVMGVTIGAAYLDKLMTPDTLTSFKTGVATLRGGLEWYLIPDVFMLYGAVNSLSFLTSRQQLTDHFTTTRPKDIYFFPDAGARAILKLSKEKGVTFLFDLGFVVKNEAVRKFAPNNDFVITTIRATLAKNFALR
ncbi:hypothetical protein MTX78_21325 [Hymenobacter tibetensis]|uniref:Outer membrane protein beta-barrel domain-containing protein n=1 Tax=Hymenobacter tibetensis TaxID=497967 RepID=A0ABY4CWK2_9BACT|nr:hypothetical protein [Hymenobacter tibetensis]UOG74646.1 hypothetical protein MTX78_21325 [Hymenobacter tibetensis]